MSLFSDSFFFVFSLSMKYECTCKRIDCFELLVPFPSLAGWRRYSLLSKEPSEMMEDQLFSSSGPTSSSDNKSCRKLPAFFHPISLLPTRVEIGAKKR